MTHTERLHALLQTFDGAMRDVLKHAIKERDQYWMEELESQRERLGVNKNASQTIPRLFDQVDECDKALHAERSRSLILIETLKMQIIDEREYFEAKPHKALAMLDIVEQAIAFYEANP